MQVDASSASFDLETCLNQRFVLPLVKNLHRLSVKFGIDKDDASLFNRSMQENMKDREGH